MTRASAVLVTAALLPALPQAPPKGGPGDPACRNVPTSLTQVTTAPGGFSSTFRQTCRFDRQAFRGTCSSEYSDGRGTSNASTTTFVTTYASIEDFLDEIRVVPPLFKALKSNATTTGPAGRTSETTYTYDGQGRLTKEATAGAPTTATYTEWDPAGRPTKVHDMGRGFNNTREVSFDDVQRTRTTRVIPAGQGQVVMTTVETFDVDGNPVRQVATGGPSTTTTTITINSTQRICR
jgi:YD repeat-containing protein